MRLQLSAAFALTDEHGACRNGVPVLVDTDGKPYEPEDLVRFLGQNFPAGHWVALLGKLRRDESEREFCRQFLRQWPGGPQL